MKKKSIPMDFFFQDDVPLHHFEESKLKEKNDHQKVKNNGIEIRNKKGIQRQNNNANHTESNGKDMDYCLI